MSSTIPPLLHNYSGKDAPLFIRLRLQLLYAALLESRLEPAPPLRVWLNADARTVIGENEYQADKRFAKCRVLLGDPQEDGTWLGWHRFGRVVFTPTGTRSTEQEVMG